MLDFLKDSCKELSKDIQHLQLLESRHEEIRNLYAKIQNGKDDEFKSANVVPNLY